ncbi:hypothetical protein ACJA3J_03935 [Halobacillus sp. SY10]|uniref:hypothetical protein n=1 Tax=Halobacillus sp. SY10 TaxID=3381356 RepID=UPI0038798B5D
MLQRSYAEIQQKLQIVTEARTEAEETTLKEKLADTEKSYSNEVKKLENECAQLNEDLEQKKEMIIQGQQDFSFLQNNFNNERTARLKELQRKKRAQQECEATSNQLEEANQKPSKAAENWKESKEALERKNDELAQRAQAFMKELEGVKESLVKAGDDYSELQTPIRKKKRSSKRKG